MDNKPRSSNVKRVNHRPMVSPGKIVCEGLETLPKRAKYWLELKKNSPDENDERCWEVTFVCQRNGNSPQARIVLDDCFRAENIPVDVEWNAQKTAKQGATAMAEKYLNHNCVEVDLEYDGTNIAVTVSLPGDVELGGKADLGLMPDKLFIPEEEELDEKDVLELLDLDLD